MLKEGQFRSLLMGLKLVMLWIMLYNLRKNTWSYRIHTKRLNRWLLLLKLKWKHVPEWKRTYQCFRICFHCYLSVSCCVSLSRRPKTQSAQLTYLSEDEYEISLGHFVIAQEYAESENEYSGYYDNDQEPPTKLNRSDVQSSKFRQSTHFSCRNSPSVLICKWWIWGRFRVNQKCYPVLHFALSKCIPIDHVSTNSDIIT